MNLPTIARRLLVAEGHTEPLGRLDRMNGRADADTEDFAAEARAEVSTPKGGKR
jgi:hypothetical protein